MSSRCNGAFVCSWRIFGSIGLWAIQAQRPQPLPASVYAKAGNDPDKLMAHVYVMHMGDLSGGQMIKRKVPGEGRMYQFDTSRKELKEAIRAKTNDGMADEAKWVFESATNTFKELMELDIEHYMEQTD